MSVPTLYVCGRYEGGMRDFHLSLMHDSIKAGETPASLVRVTREIEIEELLAEHARHGVTQVHVIYSTSWWKKQILKLFPILSLKMLLLQRRINAVRTVITGEGFCFWSLPATVARRVEIFYHDPKPHESADQGKKVRFENAYKKWVHEKKPWKAVLVGSHDYLTALSARSKAPVRVISFPKFTRHLFPAGRPVPELNVRNYVLLYGRIDRYKGVYEWLSEHAVYLDNLPPVVLAGRIVDDRVLEFKERVTIIDRFILNEEVASLFCNARAVVLPYISVTHSGIGDISISFGKPTYIPSLPYFVERYEGEPLARPIFTFLPDLIEDI